MAASGKMTIGFIFNSRRKLNNYNIRKRTISNNRYTTRASYISARVQYRRDETMERAKEV